MKFINKFKEKYKDRAFYKFFNIFFKNFKKADISKQSAESSYFLILSIFPFIIALLNLFVFSPISNQEFLKSFLSALPKETRELMQSFLKNSIETSKGSILSISVIAALWSSSRGTLTLMKAVDSCYEGSLRGNLKAQVYAFVFNIFIIFIILLASAFSIFEALFKNALINIGAESFIKRSFSLFPIFQVLYALILIYVFLRYGIERSKRKKIKFFDIVPGTVFAFLSIVLFTYFFKIYTENFANFSKVYGSLVGVIVLMLWFNFTSSIIICAAVLNSSISEYKRSG